MIHGIGIDMMSVGRFKSALDRRGDALLKRLFTDAELGYCLRKREPERHLAARFAVKVSFFKAFGNHIGFKSVEIIREDNGRPTLVAKGLDPLFKVNISITHDGDLSVAETILERAK